MKTHLFDIFSIPNEFNSPSSIGRKAYYLGFLAGKSLQYGFKTPIAYVVPYTHFHPLEENNIHFTQQELFDHYQPLPNPNDIPESVVSFNRKQVDSVYDNLTDLLHSINSNSKFYIRSSTICENKNRMTYPGVNYGGFLDFELPQDNCKQQMAKILSSTYRAYSTLYYALIGEKEMKRPSSLLITEIVDIPCVWGTAYVDNRNIYFKGTDTNNGATIIKRDEQFQFSLADDKKDIGRFKQKSISEVSDISKNLLKDFADFIGFECPLEIEFCIDRNDCVNILQLRPLSGFFRFHNESGMPINSTIGRYSYSEFENYCDLPKSEQVFTEIVKNRKHLSVAIALQSNKEFDLFNFLWLIAKSGIDSPLNIIAKTFDTVPHLHFVSALIETPTINSFCLVDANVIKRITEQQFQIYCNGVTTNFL